MSILETINLLFETTCWLEECQLCYGALIVCWQVYLKQRWLPKMNVHMTVVVISLLEGSKRFANGTYFFISMFSFHLIINFYHFFRWFWFKNKCPKTEWLLNLTEKEVSPAKLQAVRMEEINLVQISLPVKENIIWNRMLYRRYVFVYLLWWLVFRCPCT